MAEVLPNSRRETIAFFEARLSTWSKDPGSIGLTSAQVAELCQRVEQAGAAQQAAGSLRQASLAATGTFHERTDHMRALGADLIKLIRAFALASDDDRIFARALIPPPKRPSPAGPPSMPTQVEADILHSGDIAVRWKGLRSYGTQFIIERRMIELDAPAGPFVWVGHSVTNDFTDTAVPRGFAGVGYRVHAIRAGGTSDASNTATIYFGTIEDRGHRAGERAAAI